MKSYEGKNLDSVVAFLYKEDASKYDISNIKDFYELYMFNATFYHTLKDNELNRLKLMIQSSIPGILKESRRSASIVDKYANIKDYVNKSIDDYKVENTYDYIIRTCNSYIKKGYVCFLDTYDNTKEKETKPYHHVYLAKSDDIDNFFYMIMGCVLDVANDALSLVITYQGIDSDDIEAETLKQTIRKTTDGFIYSDIK